MEIQELNNVANDLVVARLEIEGYKQQLQAFLEASPQIRELESKINEAQARRDEIQAKMIEGMKAEKLKSWKTEQANYSIGVRKSVVVDPAYKKQVEDKLKKGEEVENWTLKETEYMSVRVNK